MFDHDLTTSQLRKRTFSAPLVLHCVCVLAQLGTYGGRIRSSHGGSTSSILVRPTSTYEIREVSDHGLDHGPARIGS